jgi:EPS-associated MarR family transcriptional regulator
LNAGTGALNDETHYRLLKLIEANPEMSQRALADAMGVSLGKINYCLRAVIARGWIKAKNFTRSQNKRAYAYYLTPKGATEKAKVTARFLKLKVDEYQELQMQIEQLKQEVAKMGARAEESKEQA